MIKCIITESKNWRYAVLSVFDNERDDFWDIDKLVPRKKTVVSPFVSRSTLKDHNVPGERAEKSADTKLSFTAMRSETTSVDETYSPAHELIKRVTIKKYVDKYDFYDNFRKSALLYFDYKTEKCDFVPFYSYMPQYSQLTPAQKGYYFYWRDEVRHSRYIKCDYSYLYLYVYEILNLPDKIAPTEGNEILSRLWREYRKALPRIDAYFSVWIQDYCLLYNLECPMKNIGDFIFDVISASDFKEFYLSDFGNLSESGVDSAIAYLSDYDWRRAKCIPRNDATTYKRRMHEAMGLLLRELFAEYFSAETGETKTVTRVAFPHSLCTHSVKSRLEIEYIPIARDERLRGAVTLGVRYTENKLRSIYGIKSRLAVKDFPDKYKRIIDGYFDEYFAAEKKRQRFEAIPEYEKLYDAPTVPLSAEGADEIEKLSWTNTFMLVEEISEIDENAEQNSKIEQNQVADNDTSDNYGLSDSDLSLIVRALEGGIRDDAAADRINEAFSDGFGDVILEHNGDEYIIIDDYKEEIEEWLKKLKK